MEKPVPAKTKSELTEKLLSYLIILFSIAFGPKENPQIAVSVFVENGGYGASIAAPIATLMIEKYLKRKITKNDLLNRILTTDLSETYQLKNYEKQ